MFVGRFVEQFVAFAGLVAREKAGGVPVLDRARGHTEPLGGLCDGEQPARAEPLAVAGEVVVLAEPDDAQRGEWLSGAGSSSGLVELFGGLGVGVIVEQLVDQLERVGIGLAGLPDRWWERHRQRVCLPAFEACVRGDVLVAGEGDVFDEQPDHAFALALRGGGIVPQSREV